jgi:hypothetical protein
MSPEMLLNQTYNYKTDIWSIGKKTHIINNYSNEKYKKKKDV